MGKDFLNLVDIEHINLLCNVLNITHDGIQDIYVNPGRSANNSNYVFVVDNISYLYRIPGAGTDKFCSRTREALAYKMLTPFKITDEVIYLSEDTGIKISKYYEESKIPSHTNKDELIASMHTLKKLHEYKIDFPFTDTLFDRMERYKTFVYEVGGEKYFLPGFDKYLANMQEFKKYLDNIKTKLCFTHGDASINNILITKEYNYPILIDMEFPAMGDPFEDIATFCVDADYRKEDIILMLEYYLGREGTLKEKYHVLGLSTVAAMMWYSWAAYKCAVVENNQLFINFRNDYHQYIEDVYGSAIGIYNRMEDIE
mgnify:CR=1 FL=1